MNTRQSDDEVSRRHDKWRNWERMSDALWEKNREREGDREREGGAHVALPLHFFCYFGLQKVRGVRNRCWCWCDKK